MHPAWEPVEMAFHGFPSAGRPPASPGLFRLTPTTSFLPHPCLRPQPCPDLPGAFVPAHTAEKGPHCPGRLPDTAAPKHFQKCSAHQTQGREGFPQGAAARPVPAAGTQAPCLPCSPDPSPPEPVRPGEGELAGAVQSLGRGWRWKGERSKWGGGEDVRTSLHPLETRLKLMVQWVDLRPQCLFLVLVFPWCLDSRLTEGQLLTALD